VVDKIQVYPAKIEMWAKDYEQPLADLRSAIQTIQSLALSVGHFGNFEASARVQGAWANCQVQILSNLRGLEVAAESDRDALHESAYKFNEVDEVSTARYNENSVNIDAAVKLYEDLG
jgi:hypothetical protein